MKGFGIEIKNDLLEPKHVKAMSGAVWLFMWLVDHVTSITEEGTGVVLGGKAVKFEEVGKELGISPDTYTRWLDKLLEYPYIETVRTPYGISFKVFKIYKRFGKRIRKIAESTSEVKRNHKGENAESTSIQLTVNNNSKTIANLKIKFFKHPLFEKYKTKYPDRDYDLAFEEMCAWYQSKKKRLPISITALGKWLSNTPVDPKIQADRRRAIEREEQWKRDEEIKNIKPISPEKMATLRQQISKIGRPI